MKHVEDVFTPILADIREAAASLNRAGEQSSKQIEALEERLIDAEPGVTVWGPEILSEETTFFSAETGSLEPALRTVTLGFGRGKKKWGLQVRDELRGKKKPRDNDWSTSVSEEITPLRKADRDLRILAVPHLQAVAEAVSVALRAKVDKLIPAPAEQKPAVTTTVDELVIA